MPGDLELQTERSGRLRAGSSYDKAIERYAAARKARTEAEERRRLEEARARQEAALQNQQLAAQAQRQQQEQAYGLQSAAQRANINADAANMDHVYTTQRDQLQQKGIQKRDQLLAGYDKEAERRKALDQQIRDTRQFGFQTDENNQKFGQQLKRDEVQQQYSTQSEQQQHGNQLERDASQFGYSTLENRQQQRHTLERDAMQFGQQMQRDEVQNDYSMQRSEQEQQFTQQNLYQRETADVAAKWQEQVQTARNSGLDFSPRQQQEMKEMDASFRKNVLGNPDLDEGLRQRAMLMHQQKLALIIPEDKVQDPKQGLDQSVLFHEPTNSWFMVGRDPKGNTTYEPLGTNGGGPDPAKQQAEQQKQEALQEKKAAELRKLERDRENDFQKLHREIKDEIDPETLEKVYKNQDEVDEEALKRFASDERFYTGSGLQPHEMYQLKAQREEQKKQRDSQRPSQYDVKRTPAASQQPSQQTPVNPYRQQPQAQPMPPADPRQPITNPVTVSSKNLDDQVKQSITSGDEASAAAMQAVKTITAKFKGVPPLGTPERAELEDAMRFLGAKGFKFAAEEKKAKQFDFQENLGGWQQ